MNYLSFTIEHTKRSFDTERALLRCHVSIRACGSIYNRSGLVGTLLVRRDVCIFDCQLLVLEWA
jgi:hypothetical protein